MKLYVVVGLVLIYVCGAWAYCTTSTNAKGYQTYSVNGQCYPCYPGTIDGADSVIIPSTVLKTDTYGRQGVMCDVACWASYYCPDFVQSVFSYNAYSCPMGSYCPLGSSAPVPCNASYYCPTGGLSVSTPCTRGNYCPAGASVQTACAPGYYCPYDAAASPTPCVAGTYNAASNATSCAACWPGTYSVAAATSCQNCTPGKTKLPPTAVPYCILTCLYVA
jgi:hypothetical protein